MKRKGKVGFHVQGIVLPRAIAADLRGKRSVRATFKLSEHTINTVSLVASHLGIKQKSLFDHLLDDIQVLKSIASEIEGVENKHVGKIQKTFVISRKSLDYLDNISKQFHTPRDLLIEFSVNRLLPIIEKERLQNVKRKKIFAKLQDYFFEGKKMLDESIEELGGEDLTINMLYSVLASTEKAAKQLDIHIKKGDLIEELFKKNLKK